MKLYVLKSTVTELGDYGFYGVYQFQEQLLQAVEELISCDFAEFEELQANYGFSGFVCIETELDKPASLTDGICINWNAEKCQAELAAYSTVEEFKKGRLE